MMFCAQWVDRYPVEGTQVSQVGQFAHHQQCGDFPGEGIEAWADVRDGKWSVSKHVTLFWSRLLYI